MINTALTEEKTKIRSLYQLIKVFEIALKENSPDIRLTGQSQISICSVSRAEVCPNANISHCSLSKHEKNSPSPDPFWSGEGLFFY